LAFPGFFLFSFVHASMTPSKRKTPASTELKKGLSLRSRADLGEFFVIS